MDYHQYRDRFSQLTPLGSVFLDMYFNDPVVNALVKKWCATDGATVETLLKDMVFTLYKNNKFMKDEILKLHQQMPFPMMISRNINL
jgi:hypothetical protein